MSKLKKKKKKKQIANLKATLLTFLALTLLGGVGVTNHIMKKDRQNTGDDFCQRNAINEITAILVDHTDKFTPVQKEALRVTLTDIAMKVKKHGMLQLYSVGRVQTEALKPEFSLCNPGDEEDFANMVGHRASTVRKNYQNIFLKNLNAELDKIINDGSSDQSPIMESVQSVIVTSFNGEGRAKAQKNLIVVSDLLQNTPNLSLLNHAPDFNQYKNTDHWQQMRENLQDVNVNLLYLRRDKGQSENLQRFWEHYFENQGANLEFHRI